MAAEAEIAEPISVIKIEGEDKELNCVQFDACSSSFEELQKGKDKLNPPLATIEKSTKTENGVAATDIENETASSLTKGKLGTSDTQGGSFFELPSQTKLAFEDTTRPSDTSGADERTIPIKKEASENEIQTEDQINEAVEETYGIIKGDHIDAPVKHVTADTSLENAKKKDGEPTTASELPTEEKSIEKYVKDKLPSLSLAHALVDPYLQDGKVENGQTEVVEEKEQKNEELSNDKLDSRNIEEEKAENGLQKDNMEGKRTGKNLDLQPGEQTLATIEATSDNNQEFLSLTTDLIRESLKTEVIRVVGACNNEESINKNFDTNTTPIKQVQVFEGLENACTSEKIEKQITEDEGVVNDRCQVHVGKETEEEKDKKKVEEAATKLEPEDQSQEINSKANTTENDIPNDEVKSSDSGLLKQDIETTSSNDKLETTTIKDEEDPKRNLNAPPATNAPSAEALEEEVSNKLEEVSDLVPKEPIQVKIKTDETKMESEVDEAKQLDSYKVSLADLLSRSTKESPQMAKQLAKDRNPSSNKEDSRSEEEDYHKKADSGFNAPIIVEATRDVDAKPHKKSLYILSGVGSIVKDSIAKVKKAIACNSSRTK